MDMMVMILETVPVGLRGELTRWLIEPHPGVFVGHVSALVRDRLWQKCCGGSKSGGVIQVWSTSNEQHFQMRIFGNTRRQVADFEGLQLIRLPVEPESPPDGKANIRSVPKAGHRSRQPPVSKGY
jgi:CRISPR-associated protein Cas2